MCLSENVVKADGGISPLGIRSISCINTEIERDLLKKQIIACLKAFVLRDQEGNGEYFLSPGAAEAFQTGYRCTLLRVRISGEIHTKVYENKNN